MKPDYDACNAKFMDKLTSLVPAMDKPLATSRIVEQTFIADGDRYFHYYSYDKWSNKLISYNPESE